MLGGLAIYLKYFDPEDFEGESFQVYENTLQELRGMHLAELEGLNIRGNIESNPQGLPLFEYMCGCGRSTWLDIAPCQRYEW